MRTHRWLGLVVGILAACLTGGTGAAAGEIGWIEKFVLADDRSLPLEQLIPGTEDYYYYHALHYQNTEQWDKVEQQLKALVDRYNWTPRAIEIENRQALLRYKQDPQRTLELIRRRLNLQFNHQRELLNQKPDLPTRLDPAALAPAKLDALALAQYPNTLEGFEDAALDRMTRAELSPEQRRQLLARLDRPDHAQLVKLILADLNYKDSSGFGQFNVHRRLLLAQLDELLKLKPDLRGQTNFVNVYLARLHPSADANWRQDPAELRAYLDRLWTFVRTLDPVFNSLKAHVLYHRLVLDRSQGKYDRALFLEYLQLPKQASYVEPKYLAAPERQSRAANLAQAFDSETMLPPVGDDEPLVRSYLQHFLVEADDYKPFAAYVNDQYLKQTFAETKIVSGLGDAEKWYALLPPAVYQQLKERIDLDFAFTNKTELAVDDLVSLDLYVKNVETLIVKVFEVNTRNFYVQNLKDIGTDINLDGLIANQEKTYRYKEPPLRRVRRHFEFPGLDHRGVYVIDFIGNGKASRALIRKGKLRYLVRTGVAGQVFTVFDELRQPVPQATLWLAGTLYEPDDEGALVVPFSNQPGRQPIVLSVGGFSSLEHFQQESEHYEFQAGLHVDREELIARRQAQLILRPRLSIHGTPVSRKALENVRLSITSTDLDGVSTTKDVANFKLFEDRETTYPFQVPQRLASIRFQLRAQVQNHSQNQKVDLSAEQTFSLNEIDRTEKTEDLHFARAGENYLIDVLGKTGEARADRPVQIVLKLRDYKQPVHVTLQTDDHGRVLLGPLPGVDTVTAAGPQGTSHSWPLRSDEHTYPQTLNADSGVSIEVPYMGRSAKPDRAEVSLLELRGDDFLADRFDHVALDGGLFQIEKLPPGDYSLLLKRSGRLIRLRVTAGEQQAGYVLGDYRQLELRNTRPLQLAPVEVDEKTVRVHLQNATPLARVHVFATRFQPAYSAYDDLASIVPAEPYAYLVPRIESQYEAGRNIGDEYRYIIDRKFARKFPGNMLERPSLLLNPWAIRSTETGQQEPQSGELYAGVKQGAVGQGGRSAGVEQAAAPRTEFADLDFLAGSSLVLANVIADKDGNVVLARSDLGAHQELWFVAVDPQNTASRRAALPRAENEFLDLRLAAGLDPKRHYTQQKRISVLPAKGKLVVPDITSSRFEAFDSLARVYLLYATLSGDNQLADFGFLRNWPTLKTDERREVYRKYAGHELHFFLHQKDRKYFDQAIRPYLANKKEKQFLDHWLLDDDLGEYLKSWNFEQLNALERILLAQRVKGEAAITASLIRNQYELLPPDAERFNQLFQTALKGGALDTGDAWGLKSALQGAEPAHKLPAALTVDAPAEAAASHGAPAAPSANRPERSGGGAKGNYRTEAGKLMKKLRERSGDKDGRDMEQADEAEVEFFSDDAKQIQRVQQYYRKLDKTMEWVESNYYHLPLEQQTAALIGVNAFWRDYAEHAAGRPFLSTELAEATHNLPEMLAALALTDLPFEPSEHKTEFKGTQMTLTAGSPMVVYYEKIQPAEKVAEHAPILVSENFYRHGDRHRQVGGEQLDKFVTDEFLIDTVYGCQIVVTNPSSSKKKIDVLLQVPTGALPVAGAHYTRSIRLDLEPYHTQTLEYQFYFPGAGKFAHYPVQVASNGEVLAFAEPFTFNVVRELTQIDKESWDYISQHGTADDVIAFLKRENLLRINLERIAWRMQDKAFFARVVPLLAARHVYHHTLWSYAVKHDDLPAMRQFLQFSTQFVQQCGEYLESPPLTIDPVVRKTYEHMDYRPLVNARVGQLGRQREILNDRFLAHYQHLLRVLSYRRQLDDTERLSSTYYLLLQDRVDEALQMFAQLEPDAVATRLQYDYCAAYLSFYKSEPKRARQIAAKYLEHPVERWRLAFANIVHQADEIGDGQVQLADQEDRTQLQTRAAAATPAFEFTVEGRRVKLTYQRLSQVRVNYYLTDIELLFSRNPFVQGESKQFSYILPNRSQTVELPDEGGTFEFPLPDDLASSNVLVEIAGAGSVQSQPYYSHALGAQVIEQYGQVRVTQGQAAAPLTKVYVKVYARLQDGSVRFFKDGYTDLRGRFDYASLSTNELDFVDRFALLVLSDEYGAVVREAKPPKR